MRQPWRPALERGLRRFPGLFYGGGICAVTALATAGWMAWLWAAQEPAWKLLCFGVVFLLCASQLAMAVVNWLCTLLVRPRLLPRLDYSAGIALECPTMVVVPAMLTSQEGVARLIETLEIHYLANRDPQLRFALLTDFRDAPAEVMPEDQALGQQARAGIERLNQKHPAESATNFFLFHRPRRWNAGEGVWMGCERKRGKLTEFNCLLRGGARGCFSEIVGDTSVLPSIRFVITLDTDTQLPREAAHKLVGALAHPLNRPPV